MTQKPNRAARAVSKAAEGRRTKSSWTRANAGWLTLGAAAVGIAASAAFNHAAARRAEAANPPAGEFVEVDGVRLHYVDRGSGSPVVLLHGNGVMLQDFEVSGVLRLAAENHRVIAFDRPGFGYSDRPRSKIWTPQAQAALIAAALDQLGVGPAIIVGHSWGTLVGLAMALDHPKNVGGLVLLSGYYYGSARPDVLPLSLPAIPIIGDLMAHTVSPLSGVLLSPVMIKASFAPAHVSAKFAGLPASLMLRPSQVRATAADTAMMVPGAMSLSGRYAELTVPVIIMAGEGDLIAHVRRHAARLAEEVTGSELRVVPGQGHLFHYAFPEEVVKAIDEASGSSTTA